MRGVEYLKELPAHKGKLEILGVTSMTRKGNQTDHPRYYQCPCCEITKCFETKIFPGQLPPIEEMADQSYDLITEDSSGKHCTKANVENNKLSDSTDSTASNTEDLIPVDIAHELEKQRDRGVVKTSEDADYVSLNLNMLKRTKSDGGIKYNSKQKPNCYFGRRDKGISRKAMLRHRTKSEEANRTSVEDEGGITVSPVFFSSIGEWTIVDLNLEVFEREDANRIFYLRMKGTAYKEVEPENAVCTIL